LTLGSLIAHFDNYISDFGEIENGKNSNCRILKAVIFFPLNALGDK
jgi:hypothetical protein